MKGLTFILVDDNSAYRKALKTILIKQFDAIILAEASSAEEMLAIQKVHKADIILMDVMMPGKSGIELAKELLWFYDSRLKIIAITMHVDKVYLTTLLETGFKGCIFKDELAKKLNEALFEVMNGRLYFPDKILLDNKGSSLDNL